MSLLSIQDLAVTYGDIAAVRGVTFEVASEDTFVLLGANGAGKTSILRSICGLVTPAHGRILVEGADVTGARPHQVARRGIAHVPEGRRIFGNLTVEDNLKVAYIRARADTTIDDTCAHIYELFPRLAERRRQLAGTLSGGEQQMVAIGRALMNFPSLLMLDEPSLGLSPLVTEQVFERLVTIRTRGIAILLVEQNAAAIDIATRGMILQNGSCVRISDRAGLEQSDFVRRAYLGL
jgi:branched-chain amino acid transport system ATP-binding protein